MATVSLKASALAPGVSPIEIHYREWGSGTPLVFLHGGWGYEFYSFQRQVDLFAGKFRIIAPDRTGYGHSTRVTQHPDAFHLAAANETTDFLDAIGVKRPVLWGHSDGAVIAAIMGLTSPDRFPGLILEAFHFYRNKAGSRDFFETMFEDPDRFGERVAAMLAREHGPQHWREVLEMEGRAWLKIIEESSQPEKDLFGGRLSELAVPTVFIHGERDPRTEPGELDALKRQLPRAGLEVIGGAGHSPHTESAAVDECNTIAERFLAKILA